MTPQKRRNKNMTLNGPVVTAQPIGYQASRGKLPGVTPIAAEGRITTVGATNNVVLTPNTNFKFPNQTTGEIVTFVSTSDQDKPGGTGIHTMRVFYLDLELNENIVDITLNGQTPVTGQLSECRFIQDMVMLTYGTSMAAVGRISAYWSGDPSGVFATIEPTFEKSESSLRMAPKGKRLVIDAVITSSVSTTADATAVTQFVATQLAGISYLDPFKLMPQGAIGTQNNGIPLYLPNPAIYTEGHVVGYRVTTNKAATILADWFGWLETATE